MALRIKDNVDLKELEKYGFNLIKDYKSDKYYAYLNFSLRINLSNRKLVKNDAHFDEYELDIVYNLIKDGLVIKVDD